jgi:branched-chain amino acid transport system substrate-binding protein
MSKWIVVIFIVALTAQVSPAAASGTYTINVILPMTGPGAAIGADEATSLRLYETQVNATGGIRGTQVHFEVHDDQSSPQLAVQETSLMLQQHPAVILGSAMAAQCQAMAALASSAARLRLCNGRAQRPDRSSDDEILPRQRISSPCYHFDY